MIHPEDITIAVRTSDSTLRRFIFLNLTQRKPIGFPSDVVLMVRQVGDAIIKKSLFAAVNHISRKTTRMTVCYSVRRLQVILPQVIMCIFKVNNRNCFAGESRNRV